MYAFIDVETGSLDTSQGAILQIGCIISDDDFNSVEEFCSLVKPGIHDKTGEYLKVEEAAIAINRINLEDLVTAPTEQDVLIKLNRIISKYDYVEAAGFNLAFDLCFINGAAYRNKMHMAWGPRFLDIKQLAVTVANSKKYSLKGLCEKYGVSNNKAHDALSDCRATLELAKKLMNSEPAVV